MSGAGARERWAIVEVMGHRVIPGRITGDPPYAAGICVEIPLADGTFAEEYYAAAALFGVRIVPEAQARRAAEESYYVSQLARLMLPAPARAAADEEEREAAQLVPRPAGRGDVYREIDVAIAALPEEEEAINWTAYIRQEAAAIDPDADPDEYRDQLLRVCAVTVRAIEANDDSAGGEL